ncbi:MAG: DUF2336 domain-containing protein [Hyphomicrobiales bacterium]|nr:DUF2336 domain-containing protein [Hyphomicrobiales bacterium]
MTISTRDLERLQQERSPEIRGVLAKKIAIHLDKGELSSATMALVHEILDCLSRDIEVSVRRILAETLRESRALPYEVAYRLARDVEEVASPILEFSEVLTEQDLLEIINASEEVGKLRAIARRSQLTDRTAHALIQTHEPSVARELISNSQLRFSEALIREAAECFRQREDILTMMLTHGRLNAHMAEKLIAHVSLKLQKELIGKFELSPEIVRSVTQDIKSKANVDIVSRHLGREETYTLVRRLSAQHTLNHSIVLRALCHGDMDFFIAGMAMLAHIPIGNARRLILEGNRKGFDALFQAAEMPDTLKKATDILLTLALKVDHASEEVFQAELLKRIHEGGYENTVPNMRYFTMLITGTPGHHMHTTVYHDNH